MKKTIVLTLILTMFALPAMGESVDLSTIGFSDLIELRDNVEVELKTRPEYEEKGYGGLFIGGKNINVGSYFLTCIGTVTISMWKSEREFERSYDPIMDNEYSDGELVAISVAEDTHILITKGTAIFKLADADWVPKVEEISTTFVQTTASPTAGEAARAGKAS